MDWQTQLITLYQAVGNHRHAVGWVQAQRHAPDADLKFTDAEVVTIYLFAVGMEQKWQIKEIFTGGMPPGAIGGIGFPDYPVTVPTCSA